MDIVNSMCVECHKIEKPLVIIKIGEEEIKLCDDCMKEFIKNVILFGERNYN